jgi:SAM-dependent methyltransferase
MNKGDDFFDQAKIAQEYQAKRYDSDSPNETLEKPIFMELVGDVSGQRILDLGCGDGFYALELLKAGCEAYTGLDASALLVERAKEHLNETIGQTILTSLEDWHYPPHQFDLVISRLTLHYVDNLAEVFHKVNRTLRPGGRFIFSIVHPVITSCDRSRAEGGERQDWIVDDYFVQGSRQVHFMGDYVEQYHRSIEDIFMSLQDSGFVVERLRESNPVSENFKSRKLYERRKRIPLFLFLSSRKI